MESDTGQVFSIILNCIAFEISANHISCTSYEKRDSDARFQKKGWFKGNVLKSA